jgi:hypothetical protein
MRTAKDPFMNRLRWITLAVLLVLFVWHMLPWLTDVLSRYGAEPRSITARG